MVLVGCLKKMSHSVDERRCVQYKLELGGESLGLNALIGSEISIRFCGTIVCGECGKKTKKSYSQGYCYPCAQKLPQTDLCQVRPELCHFSAGTCRDSVWGKKRCFIPHTVYLSLSSGTKVGITRSFQEETRWVDQGAIRALPIARVNTRLDSGLIESSLKSKISDKTNWRKMLKGDISEANLYEIRDEMYEHFPDHIAHEKLVDERERHFYYPRPYAPEKISSFNLDKIPLVSGVLRGIKGQYLIFESAVINIRKYTGYDVEFSFQTELQQPSRFCKSDWHPILP